jgi:hypothetical protein
MALLYGRAGRLNTKNGGFRPGQEVELGGERHVHCHLGHSFQGQAGEVRLQGVRCIFVLDF